MSWKNRVAKEWLWFLGTIFFGFVIIGGFSVVLYTVFNSPDSDIVVAKTDSGKKIKLDLSKLPHKNPTNKKSIEEVLGKKPIAKKSYDPPRIKIFGISGLIGLFVCLPLMYFGRFTIWSVRQVRQQG